MADVKDPPPRKRAAGTSGADAPTVDADEVGRFEAMAEAWWDPNGKFRPIHRFNPVRIAYIRDRLCAHFDRDPKAIRPLDGLRLLDIGCGGGLLCEPMCRLGATVVGVDAAERNVEIARLHAEQGGLEIEDRHSTAEALVTAGEAFDAVLNMEVVEHVADVGLFIDSCAALIKPGGAMVAATLNRTAKSFALAIVGAEYVLRWLPRGTHDWRKFIKPSELGRHFRAAGLRIDDMTGVVYNPLTDKWALSRDMDVNYMLFAVKP